MRTSFPSKPVGDLTPADLTSVPIWEFRIAGAVPPNSGFVRPRPRLQEHDSGRGSGVFAVRTTFVLHCGAGFIGYSSPTPWSREMPDDHLLGYLAPAIVTTAGHVPFWFVTDAEPQRTDVLRYYELLGHAEQDVWPVQFEVDVPISEDEIGAGSISAFHFIVGSDFRVERLT